MPNPLLRAEVVRNHSRSSSLAHAKRFIYLVFDHTVEFATLSRKNNKTVFEVLKKERTEELLKQGTELQEKEKQEKAAKK